jgi:hypothetical protein
MKRYFLLFFIFLISFLLLPSNSSAQVASTTPTVINARVLPTIWYSTLSVNDGDSIKIYAGVQNNSGVDFTGTAVFYVDETEVAKTAYTSVADSLKDVSVNWVAVPGTHKIQVKIFTDLPASKNLVSYESEIASVSITRKIDLEVVQATAVKAATAVLAGVDSAANDLADKIESYKKPEAIETSNVSNSSQGGTSGKSNSSGSGVASKNTTNKSGSGSSSGRTGSVLGASDVSINSSSTTNEQTWMTLNLNSFFNRFLDLAAYLVRHWAWTLLAILILILLWKLKRRRED